MGVGVDLAVADTGFGCGVELKPARPCSARPCSRAAAPRLKAGLMPSAHDVLPRLMMTWAHDALSS